MSKKAQTSAQKFLSLKTCKIISNQLNRYALVDYKIPLESTLHFVRRLRGGAMHPYTKNSSDDYFLLTIFAKKKL
jgi:hypothetical protein